MTRLLENDFALKEGVFLVVRSIPLICLLKVKLRLC